MIFISLRQATIETARQSIHSLAGSAGHLFLTTGAALLSGDPLRVPTIAAIVTGIAALGGAVAAAWMSGWNDQRSESRKSLRALRRYSVPLLIAV